MGKLRERKNDSSTKLLEINSAITVRKEKTLLKKNQTDSL